MLEVSGPLGYTGVLQLNFYAFEYGRIMFQLGRPHLVATVLRPTFSGIALFQEFRARTRSLPIDVLRE